MADNEENIKKEQKINEEIKINPINFEYNENKILVLDTGSIINGMELYKFGSNFYTTPGIIKEIRDSKSKVKFLINNRLF
jgi:rRNA maturation endonuclease Nob1